LNSSLKLFLPEGPYEDLPRLKYDQRIDNKFVKELLLYMLTNTLQYFMFPSFSSSFLAYIIGYHLFLLVLGWLDPMKKIYPFFSVLYLASFGPLAIKSCHMFIGVSLFATVSGPFLSLVYFRIKRLTQLYFGIEFIKVIFIYPELIKEVIADTNINLQEHLYQECISLCICLFCTASVIMVVYKKLCEYEANSTAFKEQIEQVNGSLENSLKERENFILSLSHEVRNLLNIIIGNTDLAYEDANDNAVKEKLKHTKVCGELLLSLINNVLDAGKIDLGNVEVCETESMIRPAIEKLWLTCHELIKKKNLTGNLTIFKNVPECLMLDQHRLNQILFNLIANAVKFTESGSIQLKISWDDEDEDKIFETIPDEHTRIEEESRWLDRY